MAVGIVFVSHSSQIAEGLVELAGQMAASVRLVAAGGTDEGGIGTSFDKVTAAIETAAIETADGGSGDGADRGVGGVVVLCDLGSAILTAETALDFLDDDVRGRVRIVDAPLVEGGVAAAVAAEGGGDLGAVVAAAESARESRGTEAAAGDEGADPAASASTARRSDDATEAHDAPGWQPGPDGPVTESVALKNREGLHARPAAEFVKLAGRFDARVTVNGVDAKSLLRIMALGLAAGDEVALSATGEQAAEAVSALADLVRSGFGET